MTNLYTLLSGKGAYAPVGNILETLTPEQAGYKHQTYPHTIYQELWHIVFWQNYLLNCARGMEVHSPEHASGSWPEKPVPKNRSEWEDLVGNFFKGIDEARKLADNKSELDKQGSIRYSIRDALENIAVHNAYHFAKIVCIRQLMDIWPPPSGGDTW